MARAILRGVAVAVAAAAILVSALYFSEMRSAHARIAGKSAVVPSPYGDIEYTERGSGPAVLVVHGSGGGYDQGELVAEAVLDERFRRITPSRFGYLRSTLPEGATFDDQAHAYAHLLDELGVDRVAVVALSHGGPSALLLAALYPDRISSLTLVSAGVASSSTDDQAAANRKGAMLTTIFRYDPLYWIVTKLFRSRLMELMGADESVVAGLSPEQRQLVDRVVDYMNPVSPRAAGVVFDNRAAMPNERIAAIAAPTLVLHAVDDALQLYHNAEFAASRIPHVTLVRFETGGHFLMAVERSKVRTATIDHILAHAGQPLP